MPPQTLLAQYAGLPAPVLAGLMQGGQSIWDETQEPVTDPKTQGSKATAQMQGRAGTKQTSPIDARRFGMLQQLLGVGTPAGRDYDSRLNQAMGILGEAAPQFLEDEKRNRQLRTMGALADAVSGFGQFGGTAVGEKPRPYGNIIRSMQTPDRFPHLVNLANVVSGAAGRPLQHEQALTKAIMGDVTTQELKGILEKVRETGTAGSSGNALRDMIALEGLGIRKRGEKRKEEENEKAMRLKFDTNKTVKQVRAINDLADKLNNYQALIATHGHEWMGEGRADLEQALSDLDIAYKEAAALGAITGPDMKIIRRAIPDMTGVTGALSNAFSGGPRGAIQKLEQAKDTLRRKSSRHFRQLESLKIKEWDDLIRDERGESRGVLNQGAPSFEPRDASDKVIDKATQMTGSSKGKRSRQEKIDMLMGQ